MIIYILKHGNSDFSGTLCGVGFSNGRGSTSSKFDRDRCIKNGCKDITEKVKSIQVAQKKKEEGKAAKAEKAEEKKVKFVEPSKELKAELKAAEKEKEEIPEEGAPKPPLEEKAEEPEKEKK